MPAVLRELVEVVAVVAAVIPYEIEDVEGPDCEGDADWQHEVVASPSDPRYTENGTYEKRQQERKNDLLHHLKVPPLEHRIAGAQDLPTYSKV
jgi:hypothetical protein